MRLALAFVGFALLASSVPGQSCAVGLMPGPGSPSVIGGVPRSVAIADLDGQNGADLVSANLAFASVVVAMNDGVGGFTFGPSSLLPVGASPVFAAVADLDGVNGPDLVSANAGSGSVTILTNDGTGNFSASGTLPVGSNAVSVALADLDGVNGPDIAVANFASDSITVLLNNGSGGFTTAPGSPFPAPFLPTWVAAADVDGVNGADLIIAASTGPSSGVVRVLLNNGSAGFTPSPTSPLTVGNAPSALVAEDLDGINGPDIAVADLGSNDVTILLNDGTGGFVAGPGSPISAGSGPRSIAVGDLDGLPGPDLVVANENSNDVTILLNDGSGAFAAAAESPFPVGQSPFSVGLGDLDSQPGLDLAVVNSGTADVTVLTNVPATPGVPGQNRYEALSAGTSLVAPGFACPTVDATAGGPFVLRIQPAAMGLTTVLGYTFAPCVTNPGSTPLLVSVPTGSGYSIPTNCSAGTNQVVNLPLGGAGPEMWFPPASTFDPVLGGPSASIVVVAPAGPLGVTLSTQGMIFDPATPSGFVITNAFNAEL